jgi:hypothetical protein
MSGWGVMNSVAIKEASAIKYPMDRFVGNWWSGSEADVSHPGIRPSTLGGSDRDEPPQCANSLAGGRALFPMNGDAVLRALRRSGQVSLKLFVGE